MKGTPEALYKSGIRASFEQHGVKNVENYLVSTKVPARYPGFKASPSAPAPSDITVVWNTNSTKKQLEQIITQKWIANWKLGNEAWADYRRTGYPFLIPVAYNGSNVVDINRGPQRLPYPAAEYTDNLTNVQSAVSNYLNGPDNLATKVWWACKPGL